MADSADVDDVELEECKACGRTVEMDFFTCPVCGGTRWGKAFGVLVVSLLATAYESGVIVYFVWLNGGLVMPLWMKGVVTFHVPVLVGSVVLFGYGIVGIFRGLGPQG